MSGFNCPLCQIGDNKQFEALSCHCLSPPTAAPVFSEAADRTLKLDVSVREVNLCCDGVANIMAGFIDTDCSDTSKSGPINLHTDGGVTGGVRALQLYSRVTNVCLASFTRDMVTLTENCAVTRQYLLDLVRAAVVYSIIAFSYFTPDF